jgi:predicted PhzF superfamily epimerase YddE/YHI9
MGNKDVGIIGPRVSLHDESCDDTTSCSVEVAGSFDFEVRAFCPLDSPFEDPATGSLNAGLAQWLIGAGLAPRQGYEVRQGTRVGRRGQIFLVTEQEEKEQEQGQQLDLELQPDLGARRSAGESMPPVMVWIGGACKTCITGVARFDNDVEAAL